MKSIWKDVDRTARAAARGASYATTRKVLVEIALVPAYASVAMRRQLYTLTRRPNKCKGLFPSLLGSAKRGQL